MIRDAATWQSILYRLGVRDAVAHANGPAFAELLVPSAFSLGNEEIDDFVAQIIHETGKLERLEENLNYRAERLCRVWPSRFKTVESAQPYAGQPAKLAERVYGGRLGNDQPGDGLKYRGRGHIMATGKNNYELLQAAIGEPLVDMPELLSTPRVALKASIAWWEREIPDTIIGNAKLVSRRVNGGSVGLEERIELSRLADELI